MIFKELVNFGGNVTFGRNATIEWAGFQLLSEELWLFEGLSTAFRGITFRAVSPQSHLLFHKILLAHMNQHHTFGDFGLLYPEKRESRRLSYELISLAISKFHLM